MDSRRAALAPALVVAFAAHHAAAQSQFGAHVGTRIGYSDNVALAPKGFEQDQRIAEVTGGLNYSHSKERLAADVGYNVQAIYYDNLSGLDEVYNTLDASSRLALVLNKFYVDMFGVYDQALRSPSGKYSFNKLAITGNRTDMWASGISPNIPLRIGQNVTGEIRYSDSRIQYKDPTLLDSSEKASLFTLGNTGARRGGTWRVTYSHYDYGYESDQDIQFETLNVEIGYWVRPAFKLFTTQGLESDYRLVLPSVPNAKKPGLDEHYWLFGADWRPSERSTLVIQGGERSFGRTRSMQWTFKARNGGINLTYAEEPSTFLQEQLRGIRRAGQLSPIDSLDGSRGNLFYLEKRSAFAFVLDRPRSGAGVRFFSEQRFSILQAVAGAIGDEIERYRGIDVDWHWQVKPLSSINVLIENALRRSTINVVDDEIKYYTFNWNRRVGRQNTLTVGLSHEASTPGSGVGTGYTENQLTVGISRWFATDTRTGVPKRFTGVLNAAPGP